MDIERAIERGKKFLRERGGYFFIQLLSAKRENNDTWSLRFSVAPLGLQTANMRINDETGKVTSFETNQT